MVNIYKFILLKISENIFQMCTTAEERFTKQNLSSVKFPGQMNDSVIFIL